MKRVAPPSQAYPMLFRLASAHSTGVSDRPSTRTRGTDTLTPYRARCDKIAISVSILESVVEPAAEISDTEDTAFA
jgi:hypothetical protein